MTEIRVVMTGPGGVGKSATILRWLTQKFVAVYDPTIEDSYRKQITVDDVTQMLAILDTAGQEEFSANLDQWFGWGEAFMVIYSITSRASFLDLENMMKKLGRVKEGIDVPLVICGNKCDDAEQRVVIKEEGQSFAAKHNSPFFEISAKENINIDAAFEALVKEARKKRISSQKAENEWARSSSGSLKTRKNTGKTKTRSSTIGRNGGKVCILI